jgi:hypothetical protein
MTWSTQADLPLPTPAPAPTAGHAGTGADGTTGNQPGASRGNRRPWPGVSLAKGAQVKGQALTTRKSPRLRSLSKPAPRAGGGPNPAPRAGGLPKPSHRAGAARDLLTYVALADVSPEVRAALASFGRTIEAGFLAKQQAQAPRQAWWNRD